MRELLASSVFASFFHRHGAPPDWLASSVLRCSGRFLRVDSGRFRMVLEGSLLGVLTMFTSERGLNGANTEHCFPNAEQCSGATLGEIHGCEANWDEIIPLKSFQGWHDWGPQGHAWEGVGGRREAPAQTVDSWIFFDGPTRALSACVAGIVFPGRRRRLPRAAL